MTRRARYAAQAACLAMGSLSILAMIASGLRGAWFIVAAAIAGALTYTAMDAFDEGARPRDPAWLRRKATGNLVYIAVAVTIITIMVGLPD